MFSLREDPSERFELLIMMRCDEWVAGPLCPVNFYLALLSILPSRPKQARPSMQSRKDGGKEIVSNSITEPLQALSMLAFGRKPADCFVKAMFKLS